MANCEWIQKMMILGESNVRGRFNIHLNGNNLIVICWKWNSVSIWNFIWPWTKDCKKWKSESIAILINLSRGTYCNVCAILQYWSPSQQNSYLTHFANPTCFTCFTSGIVNPTSAIVNPTCFTSVIVYGCDIGVSLSQWIGREILNPKHMWKSKFRLLELIHKIQNAIINFLGRPVFYMYIWDFKSYICDCKFHLFYICASGPVCF